jgi:site-specific DNA-methyltransferase (adenine-specific)
MHEYITILQLAAHYRVTRRVMERWLIEVGLCKARRTPSEKAVKSGVCRLLPTWGNNLLLLWNRQETIAAIGTAEYENTGDWSTPFWLFDILDTEFHFTLDVAASPHNTKCRRFFTVKENGLLQDWRKETVWCNPPWSADVLGDWVRKAYEEARKGATVVMLIPHWKGYEWFDRYCIACGQLRHIMGKVYFKGANGKAAARDCVVVIFGSGVKGYTNGPSIRKPK